MKFRKQVIERTSGAGKGLYKAKSKALRTIMGRSVKKKKSSTRTTDTGSRKEGVDGQDKGGVRPAASGTS